MKSESGEESVEHEAFSRKLIVVAVFVGILLIWVAQLIIIWPDWADTEMAKIAVKVTTTLIGLGGMMLGRDDFKCCVDWRRCPQ
jgi:hypothetical protein